MEAKAQQRTSPVTVDFAEFRVEASLSVGMDCLPRPLQAAVFVVAREGLGYWDFVDLDTDRGRVLIGQPQGLRIAAALWCERDLSPKEIREFCEGLFQTKVRVMNPDTGEIW